MGTRALKCALQGGSKGCSGGGMCHVHGSRGDPWGPGRWNARSKGDPRGGYLSDWRRRLASARGRLVVYRPDGSRDGRTPW
eukprot:438672-Prorocentrum_minimum.AAC.1